MKSQYPEWIDEYAEAMHNAFKNMVPCTWGPINIPYLNTLCAAPFIDKLYEAVQKTKDVPLGELARSFSCPSTIRSSLLLLAWGYAASKEKDKQKFKAIVEFMVSALKELTPEDSFCLASNKMHTNLREIFEETEWSEGSPESARMLGRLYNSLSALVYSLYRDFFPQDCNEIYGPYDASSKFGENTILLIKHLPKIKPVEIWPQAKRFKHEDVKIFQVYKDVEFKCEIIGMHSLYKGDLINNLVAYAVFVDGEQVTDSDDIKGLTDYFAQIATEQSTAYDEMSKEEIKELGLKWTCYQFHGLFKLAGMDWKPSKEMLESVKGTDVPERFEMEDFPSYEEYCTSPEFDVYWYKDLYNN